MPIPILRIKENIIALCKDYLDNETVLDLKNCLTNTNHYETDYTIALISFLTTKHPLCEKIAKMLINYPNYSRIFELNVDSNPKNEIPYRNFLAVLYIALWFEFEIFTNAPLPTLTEFQLLFFVNTLEFESEELKEQFSFLSLNNRIICTFTSIMINQPISTEIINKIQKLERPYRTAYHVFENFMLASTFYRPSEIPDPNEGTAIFKFKAFRIFRLRRALRYAFSTSMC